MYLRVIAILVACVSLSGADHWRSAGSVRAVPATDIAAVALASGFALRVPGVGACELFVPMIERWVPVAALRTPRQPGSFSLTRLADGRVLVAGGTVPDSPLDAIRACEVFDQRTLRWTSTGSMRWGRRWHIAERLPNGRVLAAGGLSQQFEFDDPATPWPDDEVPFGRFWDARMPTAELYCPASGRWRDARDMNVAHSEGASAALDDGRVLVYGGWTDGTRTVQWAVSEVYDPATNRWTRSANPAFPDEYVMTEPLTKLADGRVVTLNGVFDAFRQLPEAWQGASVFDPRTNSWSRFPSPITPRLDARATLLADGRLMIAGGVVADEDGNLIPTRAVEFWSPSTGAWTPAPILGVGRALHRQLRLSDGRVLAIAGLGAPGSSEIFGGRSVILPPGPPLAIN
ncbi:MAG TPA: hypothetical protein VEL07_01375 [Planctomycetota bacterium]|nr:hypothetical protein [Planctomycetota bacterium]